MDAFLTHCSAAFHNGGNLLLVFFLAGLTGSLTHCLSMCGPVVACQAACGQQCGKKQDFTALLPYHGGRMLTYGALGFLVSSLSSHIAVHRFWPQLSASMLAVAGLLFIGSALFPNRHSALITNQKNSFLRGALMGFMPCGLLYAALMSAATIPKPYMGVAVMWSFVLGTLPVLLTASSTALVMARRWQSAMGRLGQIGLTFNGLTLLAMALRLTR